MLRVGRIVTNAGLLAGRSWAAAVWLSKGGGGSCLYTVKRVWLAALRDLNPPTVSPPSPFLFLHHPFSSPSDHDLIIDPFSSSLFILTAPLPHSSVTTHCSHFLLSTSATLISSCFPIPHPPFDIPSINIPAVYQPLSFCILPTNALLVSPLTRRIAPALN